MSDAKLTKIVIEQENSDDDSVDTETPWAESLGNDRYRVRNSPWFAYGVSFGDIVEARPKYENDCRPYLTNVVEKSGHKTLRIVFEESIKTSKASLKVLDDLKAMSCNYEGWDGTTFFAIDVRPEADFKSVCKYLTERGIKWEYADPSYDDLHHSAT